VSDSSIWSDFGLIQCGLTGFDLGLIAHPRLQGEVKQMKDERLGCIPVWLSISALLLSISALSRFFWSDLV
jgi:hypothetical protein